MNFTVTLSKPSDSIITVDYATAPNTSTAGTDYITGSGTITFIPGDTSETITIVVNEDSIDEENETLYVDLSGATSGIVITDAQGIGTITDNDSAPSISIGDATVTEGHSGTTDAEFTVLLSTESGKTITVNYATADGTAIAGKDYTSKTENLVFNPGDKSITIKIQVSGNTLDEDDKTFKVNLSGASNATILDSSAIATITDDDAAPTISIGDATVVEGDSGTANLVYTVTLSQASGKTVTVDFATQDGTATIADNDYIAKTTTTLTFAPGDTTETITVTVNGDIVLEADETVLVKLTNPTNTSITQDTGTGTITNDDRPVIDVYVKDVDSGNNVKLTNNDTTPINFGSKKVEGESVVREFTIKNNGNTTLFLSGTSPYITISGTNSSDFTVVTGPAISLKNGETTIFSVKFDPSSSGTRNASISIANNDNINNPFVFGIKGEGLVPSTRSTPSTPPSDDLIELFFGDDNQKAAIAKVFQKDGIKSTFVIFNDAAVNENLDKMVKKNTDGHKANIITVPVRNNSDIVIAQLNGQTVKNMENKNAILEIKAGNICYTIPAEDINIDSVSKKLGTQIQLKDIQVNISVSKSSKETITKAEISARKNNHQLVVNPVEFEVTCQHGKDTVNVSKFNSYVMRTVEIPDGFDLTNITTGVVLNEDGTFSHVPTEVYKKNEKDKDTGRDVEKYYAKINSLTNSTYTVIFNPITFNDVKNHWSKNYVNDVGSRLIDDGIGNKNFAPNRAITRAEFASMIVKALGIKATDLTEKFSDVKKSDSSYNYINAAYEYGILAGYPNGKFGPQDLITREQAMTMLAKAMEITGMDVSVTDIDVSDQLKKFIDNTNISAYAKKTATVCVKNNIFAGDTKGRLTPKDNFTRAESATVLIKLLRKAGLINSNY